MGCVPAQVVPPQLAYTPGAPVIVTENFVTLAETQIAYPAGWRVITSAAESSPYLTFVPPQADALIFVSTTAEVEPPQIPAVAPGQQRIENQSIAVDDNQRLHVWFVSTHTTYQTYLPDYQWMTASLHR